MPDKQLTVATYAAGASLAAITLVYVFAPTFFIDQEAETNANSRKRGVVGLVNPANDCFINSTVQALAGLSDLRLYLIREIHRRALDGPAYRNLVEDPNRDLSAWKIEGLQKGIVTKGLKDLLDGLNERPLYKKTITAAPFVKCLEVAFRQRISRQQQDAQEFLQIVAERLCDEYHAGRRARHRARELGEGAVHPAELQRQLSRLTVEAAAEEEGENGTSTTAEALQTEPADISVTAATPSVKTDRAHSIAEEVEEGFPMEGSFESQIECLTCGFKPAPNRSTFCSLTLNVPATTATTTLAACFDGIFKTEYIDDFRCEKCTLIYAVEVLERNLERSTDEQQTTKLKTGIRKIRTAIDTDPESEGLELPDLKDGPKRKIARHIKIVQFPKILSIHLSRSIYDHRSSVKNAAKVEFPENLPLGGLLNQHKYKLSSVVTHKGSHHSGHYETFRRQITPMPYANKNTFSPSEAYSRTATPGTSIAPTPGTSIAATPHLKAVQEENNPALGAHHELLSPTLQNPASSKNLITGSTSSPRTADNSRPCTASIKSSSSSSNGSKKDGKTSPTRALRLRTRSSLSKMTNTISRTLSRSPTKDSSSGNSSPTGTVSPTADTRTLGTTTTVTTGYNTPNTASEAGDGMNLKKMHQKRRMRKTAERWWRISDERVKESKTAEVLGMQREVYLLFYELQR